MGRSLLFLLLLPAAAPAAAPTLTYLYPAGAGRGQTVVVQAAGTFEPWPVQAAVDGTGVRLTPTKEPGKFSVVVAGDAAPGLRWLRLHNADGASAPRPFLIGTLPEVSEQEPND